MEDLVAIARIARPRGAKGEVVAEVLTDFPGRFERLHDVTAVLPSGERRHLRIENAWFQNGRIVLKFEAVDSIDLAESIRDAEICVGETETIGLEHDEFYFWELEGCEVITQLGDLIGTVREVMRTGGTENLVVESDRKVHLIPFAVSICIEVDVDKKRIVVDPPAGLLDF